MNNSYNYSFLLDSNSDKATQHIAFEKRNSEVSIEQTGITTNKNKFEIDCFKNSLIADK